MCLRHHHTGSNWPQTPESLPDRELVSLPAATGRCDTLPQTELDMGPLSILPTTPKFTPSIRVSRDAARSLQDSTRVLLARLARTIMTSWLCSRPFRWQRRQECVWNLEPEDPAVLLSWGWPLRRGFLLSQDSNA